jgi:hypothetical protein
MPPRKQPMRLEDLAWRMRIDIYRQRFEDWMNTLYSAHQSGDEAYSLAERRIADECRELEDEISTLPPSLLRVLSPGLAAEYVKVLSRLQLRSGCTVDKDRSGSVLWHACNVIFSSVLNRRGVATYSSLMFWTVKYTQIA